MDATLVIDVRHDESTFDEHGDKEAEDGYSALGGPVLQSRYSCHRRKARMYSYCGRGPLSICSERNE